MRMGQGVRTGLGHGGITCVLQTQFSSSIYSLALSLPRYFHKLLPFISGLSVHLDVPHLSLSLSLSLSSHGNFHH